MPFSQEFKRTAVVFAFSALFLAGAFLQTAGTANDLALTNCPFCKPVAPTFGEQMQSTDAVIIAELVKRGKRSGGDGP